MAPKVSINLCCYNGEQYLEEAFQSVFRQSYTDWELVAINDGSTDSTERIIQRHVQQGRRIVYHAQPNAGLGAARSKALELSTGEYIAFIDQDDVWLPDKLAKQVQTLDLEPSLGLIYSDCYYINEKGTVLGTAFRRASPPPGDPFIGLLTHRNFIPCLTVVVRRDVAQKVGGFDPSLKYIEDLDLFLKIASQYQVVYLDDPLAKYRIHPGNLGGTGTPRMTRETLQVIARVVQQTHWLSTAEQWRIRKRWLFLWFKLLGQCLLAGNVRPVFQSRRP